MNLAAYLARIGLADAGRAQLAADLKSLRELQLLHTQSIAFENLNSLLRLPVPLDLPSLEAKLVESRRGGYCFEQNSLFAAVLEQLGFAVQRLAARVVWGQSAASQPANPRTHMVLLVDIAGQRFLCDVGFGGITPTAPLLLDTDVEQATPHEPFRFRLAGNLYTLQVRVADEWRDVYVFDLQPQSPADYEMANHFVCTWPQSHFRFTLMAARAFEGGRFHLRNDLLTTFTTAGEKQEQKLADAPQIESALKERFGILVPDSAVFVEALSKYVREAE